MEHTRRPTHRLRDGSAVGSFIGRGERLECAGSPESVPVLVHFRSLRCGWNHPICPARSQELRKPGKRRHDAREPSRHLRRGIRSPTIHGKGADGCRTHPSPSSVSRNQRTLYSRHRRPSSTERDLRSSIARYSPGSKKIIFPMTFACGPDRPPTCCLSPLNRMPAGSKSHGQAHFTNSCTRPLLSRPWSPP